VEVTLTERTDLVDDLAADMAAEMAGPLGVSSAMATPGVDLEQMRRFAAAADDFYRAGFWNHVGSEELVQVESPVPDPGLAWFSVLGAGGTTYGLGFYDSPEDHALCMSEADPEGHLSRGGVWALSYGSIMEMPLADGDLWQEHQLPVAGQEAYPVLYRFHAEEGFRRADADILAFVEGLLRALTATTEDELDRGRWTKKVATSAGPRKIRLSLPDLLDPLSAEEVAGDFPIDPRTMEQSLVDLQHAVQDQELSSVDEMNEFVAAQVGKKVRRRPAETPLQKAQDLVYEAVEAVGRRRIKLAREAIRICPDCAEAYVLLAEETQDRERATELYRQGMEAGERALGARAFEEDAGQFWGILETRPYMRARQGYADCLLAAGEEDAAIEHWQELLRLNPTDNQGIRFLVVPALLKRGRDDEAASILDQYEEDPSCPMSYGRALPMSYGRALLAFRREPESAAARERLETAVKWNPHLPKFLLGKKEFPETHPPFYSPQSEEEAALFAPEILAAWNATPGALDWLAGFWRRRKKGKATTKRRKTRRH